MHSQCSSDQGFRESIPEVRDLVIEYNLSPEKAWALKRPYMFPNSYYSIIDSCDAERLDKCKKESKDSDKAKFVPQFDLMTPPPGPLADLLLERNPGISPVICLDPNLNP